MTTVYTRHQDWKTTPWKNGYSFINQDTNLNIFHGERLLIGIQFSPRKQQELKQLSQTAHWSRAESENQIRFHHLYVQYHTLQVSIGKVNIYHAAIRTANFVSNLRLSKRLYLTWNRYLTEMLIRNATIPVRIPMIPTNTQRMISMWMYVCSLNGREGERER